MDPLPFCFTGFQKIGLNRKISKQAKTFIVFIYNVIHGQNFALSEDYLKANFLYLTPILVCDF